MIARRPALVLFVLAFMIAGCGGADAPNYSAQPAAIYVDGEGDDWTDLTGHLDADDGALDQLWVAHSDQHLFLRLALNRSLNLQEGNDLTLFLDADDDSTTGQDTLGLGAELSWTFGERAGRFEGTEVNHADIGLTTLPTVQADTFEIALDRSATPGGASLLQNDSLRLVLSSGDDRLPDAGETIGYALPEADLSIETPTLARPDTDAVRLMSYNAVNNYDRELNSLFIDDRQPSYRRILGAIGPDVIGFQEVYDQSAERVEATAEGTLGLAEEWHWAKEGRDLVLGSRFPILDTHAIPGYEDYESGSFLLDSEDALGSRMIVINMHPPCCNYPANDDQPSSDAQRQRVVDGVAAFIRKVKNGEGPFGVPAQTPIVILGDMNFVGSAQQPRTLRTGEIINNDDFGSSAAPDWDGTSLLDTNPRQAHAPMHTTWIDAGSSFPPGRLDYAFVTDSVLDVAHEFVLHTPVLPDDARQRHGLQSGDTNTASDHLPVVIDVQTP